MLYTHPITTMAEPINQTIQRFLDEFERNPKNPLWERTNEEVFQLHLDNIEYNNGIIFSKRYQSISETGGHIYKNNIKDSGDVLFAIRNDSDQHIQCNIVFEGNETNVIHSVLLAPYDVQWLFAGTPLILRQMGFVTPILQFIDPCTSAPVTVDITLYGIIYLPEIRRLIWTSGNHLGDGKYFQVHQGVNHMYTTREEFIVRDAINHEPFYVFEPKPDIDNWDGSFVLK
jgi:hypothetical protein